MKLRRNAEARRQTEEQVAKVEQEHSTRAALLSRLEVHLRDSCCPLCGHDHGSIDSLRTRIEKERVQDDALGSRRALTELGALGQKMEDDLVQTQQSAHTESRRVDELQQARLECEGRKAEFEDEATRLRIPSREPALVLEAIHRRTAKTESALRSVESTTKELAGAVEDRRDTLKNSRTRLT